jgi:beclin 1|tara:strand:- start:433 stop:693 length:261 start_codon:yes stop_codon:yes gene_type:complete
MTGFLQCLKEFETFAQGVDRQNDDRGGTGQHGSSSNYFKLPYQIDGDKIDGRKIGFPFSRYERWTAALKIMLVDLKSCLAWVANQS